MAGIFTNKAEIVNERLQQKMNTDSIWEARGLQDPYFGVITDPKVQPFR